MNTFWFYAELLFMSGLILQLVACEPIGEICEVVWLFMESCETHEKTKEKAEDSSSAQ